MKREYKRGEYYRRKGNKYNKMRSRRMIDGEEHEDPLQRQKPHLNVRGILGGGGMAAIRSEEEADDEDNGV